MSQKLQNLLLTSQLRRPLLNFFDKCLKAFYCLKEKLISGPIVVTPNWSLPFEIMCDASDTIVGKVLGKRKNKVFYTIYYPCLTLDDAQRNYITTQKYLLVVVFVFDKLCHYHILSKVIVYIHHAAIG